MKKSAIVTAALLGSVAFGWAHSWAQIDEKASRVAVVHDLADLAPEKDALLASLVEAQHEEALKQEEAKADAEEGFLVLIKSEFPDSKIKIRRLKSGVILSGTAPSKSSQLIVQVAADFFPRVINNITSNTAEEREAESKVVRVLRLNHLSATEAEEMLSKIFDDKISGSGLKVSANDSLGLLVLSGETTLIDLVIGLVDEIDIKGAKSNGMHEGKAAGDVRQYVNESEVLDRRRALEEQQFARQAAERESRSALRELVQATRALQSRGRLDDAQALMKQLTGLIEQSFSERQLRQQQMIAQLQQRLQTLQRRVQAREQNRANLIEQKLREVLAGKNLEVDVRIDDEVAAEIEKNTGGDLRRRITEEMQRHGVNMRNEVETELRRREIDLQRSIAEARFQKSQLDDARRANQAAKGTITNAKIRQMELAKLQAELDMQRAELEMQAVRQQLEALGEHLSDGEPHEEDEHGDEEHADELFGDFEDESHEEHADDEEHEDDPFAEL